MWCKLRKEQHLEGCLGSGILALQLSELPAQPFLCGLFFLGACSASALHGADLDGGKPVLSAVLSSLVQFQSALAELQLTVLAFVCSVLCATSSVSSRARAVRSANAAGLGHDAV